MFTVVILTKYSKDLLTPLEGKHPRGGASCWTPFQSAKAAVEPMEWKLLGERCTPAQPGLGSSGWKSGRWETSEQLQERHQDGLPAIIKRLLKCTGTWSYSIHAFYKREEENRKVQGP